MNPKEVLSKAADWLEVHGLARGTYFTDKDGIGLSPIADRESPELIAHACVLGAIQLVGGYCTNENEAVDLLRAHLGLGAPAFVADWSDTGPEPHVISTLREAAKGAD